jgi:hypothetical protein
MKFGWGRWLIVTITAAIFFPVVIVLILGVFLVIIMTIASG